MTIPADAPVGTVKARPGGRWLAICQEKHGERTWWLHALYQPYGASEISGIWREVPSWPVVYVPSEVVEGERQ